MNKLGNVNRACLRLCGLSGTGAKLERMRAAAPASKLKTNPPSNKIPSAPLFARSRSAPLTSSDQQRS